MKIRILGTAAGGGVPQWNCACTNCRRAREGRVPARTQTSVAISDDGERWFLFGASPDVRAQIESFSPLLPRAGRGTGIAGVVLPNGDMDSCAGLLSLREDEPLRVISTARVRLGVVEGGWARTLTRFAGQLTWDLATPDYELPLVDVKGRATRLSLVPVPAPGKVPPHLADRAIFEPEDNVGFRIREGKTGTIVSYFPSVGHATLDVARAVRESDVVLFDGTFWTDDELRTLGGQKTARELGHWPLSGREGSLAFLSSLGAGHKVLVHVNNTNPLLDERSDAHTTLAKSGVVLAFDGLELST